MRQYKVLAGQHIGPDLRKEPRQIHDRTTGTVYPKYISRVYSAGDYVVVDDNEDMVKRHGSDKFAMVGQEKGVTALQWWKKKEEVFDKQRQQEEGPTGEVVIRYSEDELRTFTLSELKDLARSYQIDIKELKTKGMLIGAILGQEVEEDI